MGRPWLTIPLLLAMTALAAGSLRYAVLKAYSDSDDLERRAEEVRLYSRGLDPYQDPDLTYPPSAVPVFALTVPLHSGPSRIFWVGLNLAATAGLGLLLVGRWGRAWPPWCRAAFFLSVAASKPTRAGIALGQFHLIPTVLIVAAEVLAHCAVLSGLLVGLALIKPTMAVPYAIVLAVRKRWTTLIVASAVQAALFGLCSFRLGIGPIRLTREWLANARGQITAGTIDLPTLVGRLLPSHALDPSIVSAGVLLSAVVVFYVLRRKSRLGLLSLATFVAAILTYHRHYDMVLLLPSLAYLIHRWATGSGRWIGGVALGFGLVMILPSNARIMGDFEPLYDALFVPTSYGILATVLLLVARGENEDADGPEVS